MGVEHISRMVELTKALYDLTSKQVLVGVPAVKALRRPDPDEAGIMNNSALAYIHEHGAPEANIPPRPFLRPAVDGMKAEIRERLLKTGKLALKGDSGAVMRGYHALGLQVQNKVRAYLNAGVPPPLAESTLRARARRGRKGAKAELKRRAGVEGPDTGLLLGMESAKPLIDTGQLRNAITCVIRRTPPFKFIKP